MLQDNIDKLRAVLAEGARVIWMGQHGEACVIDKITDERVEFRDGTFIKLASAVSKDFVLPAKLFPTL
jgi:hypothetical protein